MRQVLGVTDHSPLGKTVVRYVKRIERQGTLAPGYSRSSATDAAGPLDEVVAEYRKECEAF